MKTINCPNCNKQITLDISKAIDELAEVFICPECKFEFRYVDK